MSSVSASERGGSGAGGASSSSSSTTSHTSEEFLRQLNPDFLLSVLRTLLLYAPSEPMSSGSAPPTRGPSASPQRPPPQQPPQPVSGAASSSPVLRRASSIVETLTRSLPGLHEAGYLSARGLCFDFGGVAMLALNNDNGDDESEMNCRFFIPFRIDPYPSSPQAELILFPHQLISYSFPTYPTSTVLAGRR